MANEIERLMKATKQNAPAQAIDFASDQRAHVNGQLTVAETAAAKKPNSTVNGYSKYLNQMKQRVGK